MRTRSNNPCATAHGFWNLGTGWRYWAVEVAAVVVAAALSLDAAGVLSFAAAWMMTCRVDVLERPWLSVTTY